MLTTGKFWRILLTVIIISESLTVSANIIADSVPVSGKTGFFETCYGCHRDTAGHLAPALSILRSMTPRAVLAALDNGKMRPQAAALSEDQRKAVAEWITGSKLKTTNLPIDSKAMFAIRADEHSPYDHSGWGGNAAGTGYRNTAQTEINPSNVASLKLKWIFAFPDATIVRSKPAVIGKWLIVGSQFGDVYAINRITGKAAWHFSANAAIRGAMVIQKTEKQVTVYFADFSTTVYAINLSTGKLLWSKRAGFEPQSSVTGSVAVSNGLVFVPISTLEVATAVDGKYNCCSASGGLVALDAKTGNTVWVHRVITEPAKVSGNKNGKSLYGPSGAPVWCSPTIDTKRSLVYIGTGENYSYPTTQTSDAIQALDMKTGRLIWNFQATTDDAYNSACPFFTNCPPKTGPDLDFGMAPILVIEKDGKDILVAGQKSGVVYCLTPGNGKLIWQTRIGKGGMLGGIHWGMATDGKYVYAPNADNALVIDKRDTARKATPGLFALDLSTGKLIWEKPAPACADNNDCLSFNSAAPLVIPGLVFAGSLDGHIRAYSTKNGEILWDMNTVKDYGIIDGVKARGGSIDGPSAVVAGGMIYVNSGYAMFGEMGGNVLLAYGL
jgi:polyvinyl alcohol dehydrogenase (cytochrome)